MIGNPLSQLTESLSKLPGIGPKSAQRLAFFLMSMPKKEVHHLATTMTQTRDNIRYCRQCFNISFTEQCGICQDPSRDAHRLCIVAEPKELMAIERTHSYKGLYHVLGGLLSPIDGIQPDALRIQELMSRVAQHGFTEIVLALNPTIEGDATALYLQSRLKPAGIPLSKLAYGLPVGADIDYADEMTLQKSLMGRTAL